MSYKTKLQTNNNNLEGNNEDLQSILNTINELPDAGSNEAEIETVTGTIAFFCPYIKNYFYYENGNGIINEFDTFNSSSSGDSIDFIIRKNSIIVFHCPQLADGSSVAGFGLTPQQLQDIDGNGIQILHISSVSRGIATAICKVTDSFNLSWVEEDELGPI